MPAQIHAHHAIVAAEPRHPGVIAPRVTHRGMQQQQRRRLEPRVGEIVDRVGEPQAVARIEMLHGAPCDVLLPRRSAMIASKFAARRIFHAGGSKLVALRPGCDLRVCRAGLRAILSDARDPPRRAVRRGRRHRQSRAHHRAAGQQGARPADRDREPAGRRQRDRHGRGREVGARRLHAGDDRHLDRREPEPQAAALRHAEGLRAGEPARDRAGDPDGASEGAGEDAAGVRRAREGAARQVQLRVGRQRRLDASRRRAAQAGGRHRRRARALQGHRPGDERSDRRACGRDVLRHLVGAAVHGRRHACARSR